MYLSVCRRGQRREETFENVLRSPLTFPSKPVISSEAQDLISKLLAKDPAQRLGTQVGGDACSSSSHSARGARVARNGSGVLERAVLKRLRNVLILPKYAFRATLRGALCKGLIGLPAQGGVGIGSSPCTVHVWSAHAPAWLRCGPCCRCEAAWHRTS